MSREHFARLEPSPQTWVVTRGGQTVAESDGVMLLHETYGDRQFPAVPYFPPDSLQVPAESTDHHTSCPIKGQADYYQITVGDEELENAVWHYPSPVDELADIAGFLAFYPDRFEISASG